MRGSQATVVFSCKDEGSRVRAAGWRKRGAVPLSRMSSGLPMFMSERTEFQSVGYSWGSETKGGTAFGNGRMGKVECEERGWRVSGSVGIVRAGGGKG